MDLTPSLDPLEPKILRKMCISYCALITFAPIVVNISGCLPRPRKHLSTKFGNIFSGNFCITVHLFFVVDCNSATYEQIRVKSIPLPILHASTNFGANPSCSLGWVGKHELTVWFTDRLTMPQVGQPPGSGKNSYPEFARGLFLTAIYQQDEKICFNLS